ncbi:hypothetical protein XENORESO_011154, partial [Xenotaenia resolanae]
PQNIELGAKGGAGKQDSSNMEDMTVEQMAARANHVTDEEVIPSTGAWERPSASSANHSGFGHWKAQGGCCRWQRRANRQATKPWRCLTAKEINQDMRQAEKNLTDLSKCCGLCVCPCDRVSSIENDSRYKRTWGISEGQGDGKDSKVVSNQPSGVRNGQTTQTNAPPSSGPYIKKVTNDAREDEMEDNLQAVGSILGNLKDMAVNMGSEIDKQNQHIDDINKKVSLKADNGVFFHADMNRLRVDEANKRANKLIK